MVVYHDGNQKNFLKSEMKYIDTGKGRVWEIRGSRKQKHKSESRFRNVLFL